MSRRSVCFAIIIYAAANLVDRTLASDIECVPIDQCPFAYRVVKRTGTQNAPFFIDSVCGYDEKVNVKIWCNKLLECTTPENRKGTCMSVKYCSHFIYLLLNFARNGTNSLATNLLKDFRCNRENEKEVYVCCPHPNIQEAYTYKNVKDKITDLYKESENVKNHSKKIELTRISATKALKRRKRHFSDSSWDWHDEDRIENRNTFQFLENKHKPEFKGPPPFGRHDLFHNPHHDNRFKNFQDIHNINENLGEFDQEKPIYKEKNWFVNVPNKRQFNAWDKLNHFPKLNENSEEDLEKNKLRNTCSTPNGQKGICIPANICKSFLKNKFNEDIYNNLDKEELEKLRCNTTHVFHLHICCPEQKSIITDLNQNHSTEDVFVNSNNDQLNNSVFENSLNTTTLKPNSDNKNKPDNVFKPFESICGTQETSNDKILGGSTTDLGEFPWLALLQYSGKRGLVYACAGSLITDKFVITAAHCTDLNVLSKKSLTLFRIALGEYDIRNETDCFYMKFGTNCADPVQYYDVEKTFLHNFYRSGESLANDISLIKLEKKVSFTEFIRPICLPKTTDVLREDTRVIISGWGRTETEQMSPVKRKASLQLTSKSHCNSYLQDHVMHSGQICVASGNGTDSCNGDSGGAVILEPRHRSGKFVSVLVGIISFGFRPCGQFPSVITNVSQYINWIEDTVKQNL